MLKSIEDYLKNIYELQEQEERVTTNRLSEKLGITPASATGMIKKLAAMNLVKHRPYQGVELTKEGRLMALEVIRHHRLIELFLSRALGVPWDRVHEEAEKWEHVISEDIEDRIDRFLGSPRTDPHGAPIPDKNGHIEYPPRVRMCDLSKPQRVKVVEVSDHDPELLRFLGKLKIYPQTDLTITAIEPFDKSMTIRVHRDQYILSALVTPYIWVLTEQQLENNDENPLKTPVD